MSKKGKGLVLDSKPVFGVGTYQDAKSQLKYRTLMQDYAELQKDADVMKSKLEAARQRRLKLAAEVRFLRRKYKSLMETKAMNSSQEQRLVQPPKSAKQTKITKGQLLSRKEVSKHRLPPLPETKSKKRRYIGKEVSPSSTFPLIDQHHQKFLHGGKGTTPYSDQRHKNLLHDAKETALYSLSPISVLNHNGKMNNMKQNFDWTSPVLDHGGSLHIGNNSSLRTVAAFDLNQDSKFSGKEDFPTRAPIFDLNEISTGDEDFQSNLEVAKLEEAKNSLIRGLSDEQQNDLKLSLCRNVGEGSSRVGKRKITWQDPVVLRV